MEKLIKLLAALTGVATWAFVTIMFSLEFDFLIWVTVSILTFFFVLPIPFEVSKRVKKESQLVTLFTLEVLMSGTIVLAILSVT